MTYGAQGRQLERTLGGISETMAYAANGDTLTQTDGSGALTRLGYDTHGNLNSITDALNNVTRRTYDTLSREIRTTDALGRIHTTRYDAQSRTVERVDPIGSTRTEYLDGVRRLIDTDELGRIRRRTFDRMERLVLHQKPELVDEIHRYNAAGDKTQTVDGLIMLRMTLLLALDDLLAVVREFIYPLASRSGVQRCLNRHGVGQLRELQRLADGEAGPVVKTFKSYEPGFLHVDIKYLPQMPDEQARRYLFVAIDRATRWVFIRIYNNQSELSSTDFIRRLHKAAPMKISKILTDNGSQFTDRFTSKTRQPSGEHAFDKVCATLAIEHRLAPPRHPQTNGMVERFNGRISDVVQQTRFTKAAELEATLMNYANTYNHHIPQRALNHLSPVQTLKLWRSKQPELFVKRVYG